MILLDLYRCARTIVRQRYRIWRWAAIVWWNESLGRVGAALGGCEACGSLWRVGKFPGMTLYSWDGQGEDPNRDQRLCQPCGKMHVDYWTERWDEYNGSRGV